MSVTASQLNTILFWTEHSGRASNPWYSVYEVNYAVPNDVLGQPRIAGSKSSLFNSGFSFGVPQLDIGSNDQGKAAYRTLLQTARDRGSITATEFARLSKYGETKRYDLDPDLKNTYRSDKELLNTQVMTLDVARNIIDTYSGAYFEVRLGPTIDRFLTEMQKVWGAQSVFADGNPLYPLALATITDVANRTGNLTTASANAATDYFTVNQAVTAEDLKVWYLEKWSSRVWGEIEKAAQALGPDPIVGTDRSEELFGTVSDDVIEALDGVDTIYASSGRDAIDGGAGRDVLIFVDNSANVAVDLSSQGENTKTGDGHAAQVTRVEDVVGGAGNDLLMGNQQANLLVGMTGSDLLYGYGGVDHLMGGAQADALFGGEETDYLDPGVGDFDQLTGGSGADYFVFDDRYGFNIVTDFNANEDVLVLSQITGVNSIEDVTQSKISGGLLLSFDEDSTQIYLEGVMTHIDQGDFL